MTCPRCKIPMSEVMHITRRGKKKARVCLPCAKEEVEFDRAIDKLEAGFNETIGVIPGPIQAVFDRVLEKIKTVRTLESNWLKE